MPPNRTTILIGPPGTGKTTKLLNILEAELKVTAPDQIAFCSFTKKSINEAQDRAIQKFNLFPVDFPYFRTLHSLAYRATKPNFLLNKQHYKELGELLGLFFSGYQNMEEIPGMRDSGDRLLFLIDFARNTRQSLENVWHKYSNETNWYTLKHVQTTFQKYKEVKGLTDFTGLLEKFIKEDRFLPVKVAFIDEAQDLSLLQWKVIKIAFRNAKKIYIAGDDDQAIYRWAGASVSEFLNLKGKFIFLKQSFRLPKSVFHFSQKISVKIRNRYSKTFLPKERKGSVSIHNYIDDIEINRSSTWLLLARNHYLLKKYEDMLKYRGVPYFTHKGDSIDPEHAEMIYAWEFMQKGKFVNTEKRNRLLKYCKNLTDKKPWYETFIYLPFPVKEYYKSVLRNGYNLREKPKIHVGTIHSVKGGEADNVVIMTDMSAKTYNSYLEEADDEHRVFYVGATRAKENLHIILQNSNKGYSI